MKFLINIKLQTLALLFIVFLVGHPENLWAQDTTIVKTAEFELLSPSIELISVQKGDNSIDLKVDMKAKYKGSFIKLPHLRVKFVEVADTAETPLGYVITDRRGMGTFNFKTDAIKADKEGKVKFKAIFDGNKWMESADAEVSVKRGNLSLEAVKEDSAFKATLKLVDLTTGTAIPDATVGLFVKRSFFPMKIGEGKTEADGTVSIDIPATINGDSAGNITLIARLDENEEYGSLESEVVKNWGIAVSNKNVELPRALWSSHPPTWMLVTFIVLMTTVWGHYIVIVYELFRLRKEEPKVVTEMNP
jgi:hypothetical protein